MQGKKTTSSQAPVIKKLFFNHFQMLWRVALITLGIMAIVGGGGYFLDKYIKTFPLFMIIGLLISYPLAQYIIYKVFTRLVQKKNGISPR